MIKYQILVPPYMCVSCCGSLEASKLVFVYIYVSMDVFLYVYVCIELSIHTHILVILFVDVHYYVITDVYGLLFVNISESKCTT